MLETRLIEPEVNKRYGGLFVHFLSSALKRA